MALLKALLDTDTLSALMRKRPAAVAKAQAHIVEHRFFTLSVITRYEILRGLRAKKAAKQAAAFDRFCERSTVLPLTEEAVSLAADIYADLRARGLPIGDADILIVATAMAHGLVLITNNEAHFRRISALPVDNWLG
jgi:tRNA(fMet)-specific endonuclease VapC